MSDAEAWRRAQESEHAPFRSCPRSASRWRHAQEAGWVFLGALIPMIIFCAVAFGWLLQWTGAR